MSCRTCRSMWSRSTPRCASLQSEQRSSAAQRLAQERQTAPDLRQVSSAIAKHQTRSRLGAEVVARESVNPDVAVQQGIGCAPQIEPRAGDGRDMHSVEGRNWLQPFLEVPL